LVDGHVPRLTRQFKATLRQHLFYFTHPLAGPVAHARRRGLKAVAGLRNHVEGLVAFAQQIEQGFGDKCANQLGKISWPI
jgi:hypothetical protein